LPSRGLDFHPSRIPAASRASSRLSKKSCHRDRVADLVTALGVEPYDVVPLGGDDPHRSGAVRYPLAVGAPDAVSRAPEGPTLELKAGDMASLSEGVETTWHLVKLPFREMAVLL
jgi:hypothetical protein